MLQSWFDGLNKAQKILMRTAVGVLAILLLIKQEDLFTIITAVILVVWLYLEFGKGKQKS